MKRAKENDPRGRGAKNLPACFWSWASGSGRNRTAKPERFDLMSNSVFCLTGGEVGRLGNNTDIRHSGL
jgi:hypothetical protein